MKKNYIWGIILFLYSISNLNAQTYYYYKGQKQNLVLDKSGFDIYVNNNFQIGTSNSNLKPFTLSAINSNEKTASVEFLNPPTNTDYFSKLNNLKSNTNLLSVQPRFITAASDTLRISNYLFVKLKTSSGLSNLQNYAVSKNFTIVGSNQFMPLWYKVKCNKNTLGNPLEIANYLFETGNFAAAQPDFLELSRNQTQTQAQSQSLIPVNPPQNQICANDTNFGELWGLQNTTNPGIDIDVCNAWTISEGANVKVAVVDTGIDLINLDLSANILPQSYDTVSGTSPSQTYRTHGTQVSGIIGAIKNNNYQIVGVAPQSKLFSISSKLSFTQEGVEQTANGINWAVQNGADVINNSWYVLFQSDFLEDAISNALTNGRNGLGCIMIFASGNSTKPQNPSSFGIKYPANWINDLLVVGAITSQGNRATNFSCYGEKLDIVSPGENILTLTYNNNIIFDSGTSLAAPHVAGICALILSINPYLNVRQVNDIIEKTAKKVGNYTYSNSPNRPNGTWNNEMGYGLANAFEAVKLAQQMYSATLDLYIKDSADDFGIEPNTTTPYMWTSDNIWVRNANDNGLEHQNPEYSSSGTPNYVSVRVINKSSVSSAFNNQLKLYWAKASTNLSYPNPWNGGVYYPPTGAQMGHIISTQTIPVLQPGQETILTFPWVVPNPADYGSTDQWHFCLLARIESIDDPMTSTETADLNFNVRSNNNIAWKNLTVVDLIPNKITGTVAVGNLSNSIKNYNIEMFVDNLETGNPIYTDAEVSIKMDNSLYNAWVRGGSNAQALSSTSDQKKKLVNANNVILNNISFNPNEIGLLRLDFNFLTQRSSPKASYRYHVVQKDALTNQIIGGETFVINKNERELFEAEAEQIQIVNANEPVTIEANSIQEPAIYNWYDSTGNLIYQGQNLQIPNAIAESYRLEVISTTDGFKDYADIEVQLNPSTIQTMAPNPATNNVIVNYILNYAVSAYLQIIGYNGTTTNNYILNPNNTQTTINLSNYPVGYYTVVLVVNGEIIDSKTLIKQ